MSKQKSLECCPECKCELLILRSLIPFGKFEPPPSVLVAKCYNCDAVMEYHQATGHTSFKEATQ